MGLASEHVGYMQYAHAHVSVRPALKHYALHIIASHSCSGHAGHAHTQVGLYIVLQVCSSLNEGTLPLCTEGAYQKKVRTRQKRLLIGGDWCLLKSRTILHTNVKGLRRGGAAGLVNTVYQGELLAFGALGPSKS